MEAEFIIYSHRQRRRSHSCCACERRL